MPHIRNPYGRIVAVNTEEEAQEWLKKPGFSRITKEEEVAFVKQQIYKFSEIECSDEITKGVYLVTVRQGGKDGYSVASGAIAQSLKKAGIKVSTSNTGQKVALLIHAPYSILRIESPIRIIYTMFESDKIPDDWQEYLLAADLVVVPSKWCQEVFARSGVKTTVIPLGYDENIYQPIERKVKSKSRETFNFLHYNAFNIRKGFVEVFRAFNEEFRKDEPVKLILKTTVEMLPLPITKTEYPNIEIIQGKVNEAEMQRIMAMSDCFLFPSRGEGFGMTPLEAMATGMPAIVPNAHGISEYFNADYMYEVKVKETCPALYARYKGIDVGKMVVCDIDHLRKQMRWVYDHQEEALEMGQKASRYVKNWQLSKTADTLRVLIEDYLIKPAPNRPLRNILTLEKL